MQHLREVRLIELPRVEWPSSYAAFTALTASSQLSKLYVFMCGVPQGVLAHALPAAGLADMQYLSFADEVTFEGDDGTTERDYDYWSVDSVVQLVSCCPSLVYLQLSVSGPSACAALKPVTALTLLCTSVACDSQADVDACVLLLAELSALCSLELRIPQTQKDLAATLLPLTALRQLTNLEVLGTLGDFDRDEHQVRRVKGVIGKDSALGLQGKECVRETAHCSLVVWPRGLWHIWSSGCLTAASKPLLCLLPHAAC